MTVFTYRPPDCRDAPLLMVFHGMRRNAEEYRDHARSLADRCGCCVMAPLFDPPWSGRQRYQKGGLLRGGRVAPPASWTWNLVPRLIDHVRELEGRPDLRCCPAGALRRGSVPQQAGRVRAHGRRAPGGGESRAACCSRPGTSPTLRVRRPSRSAGHRSAPAALPGAATHALPRHRRHRAGRGAGHPPGRRQARANRLERGRNAYRAAARLAATRNWHAGLAPRRGGRSGARPRSGVRRPRMPRRGAGPERRRWSRPRIGTTCPPLTVAPTAGSRRHRGARDVAAARGASPVMDGAVLEPVERQVGRLVREAARPRPRRARRRGPGCSPGCR